MAYRGFIREHSTLSTALYAAVDVAMIVLSALVASQWRFGEPGLDVHYRSLVLIVVLLALIIFPAIGLYDSWRGRSTVDQIRAITVGWASTLLVLVLVGFLLKESAHYSRLWFGTWALLSWPLLCMGRIVSSTALRELRVRGWNCRRVLVVGTGDPAQNVITQICASPSSGWKIVAAAVGNSSGPDSLQDVKSIRYRPGLDRFVKRMWIDEVWLCLPLEEQRLIEKVLWDFRHCTATLRLVPSMQGRRLIQYPMTEVLGLPMLNLSVTPMRGFNRIIKAVEDRLLATIILILISPILATIAVAVKLTSPGPVLYKQPRHGSSGRVFNVLKFRTMVEGADKGCDTVPQAKRNDPRVTPVGKFLRNTSLDELPQFFNVLRGEMSIVGPRPHAVVHNEMYKEQITAYMQRHKVKPGITGWAQINGWRGETDTFNKMQKRIEHDLYYIENWSLWFDLGIIVLTIFKGFTHKNAY